MAMSETCAYCRRPMTRRPNERLSRSRDHVLPREWGGRDRWDNYRVVCRDCNSFRAQAGHCVGVMACALTVARDNDKSARNTLREWRLPPPAFAKPRSHRKAIIYFTTPIY